MIRDRNIEWARQRMYIPMWHFQGLEPINAVPGTQTTSDVMTSADDAAPGMNEIGALGFMGMPMTANDSVSHVMGFPSFWDIRKEIGVRVHWTADIGGAAVATDAAEWLVVFDQVDADEALAAPATALNTVIANDVYGSTTDAIYKITERGIINANVFDVSALDGLFAFNVELQAVTTFSGDEVNLLGIAFDYFPLLTVGGHNATITSRQ